MFFLLSLALVGGLMAFVRGFVAYRRNPRVSSVALSSVAELAVGEVRLTGIIEPVALTLVSPLQSKPAVWYRASITDGGRDGTDVLRDERAVAFSLRDETGTVQVVPRDVNWVVPAAFSASTDREAAEPAGLQRRDDSAEPTVAMATADDSAAASPSLPPPPPRQPSLRPSTRPALPLTRSRPPWVRDSTPCSAAKRDYQEARLEPGQRSRWWATRCHGPSCPPTTRRAGRCNPADGPADQLVISAEPGGRLVVYAGDPSKSRGRHDQNFLLGLGGAITASIAGYALIVLVNGSM